MTVNPRRPGFRLPWTDDGDESGDSTQTAQATAEPGSETDVTEPVTASASADAPVAGSETSAEIAEAAGAERTSAVADATTEATPEPTVTPTPEVDFLSSLVSAMRGVAEEARDTSIAELRASVEERVEQLRTAAAERADDLRRRAELDLVAIEDWERSEEERVKSEAQHRAETRRHQLEQQLADHQAATDLESEATRQRLGDHERELDAFFTQLSSVSDPAAFVAAAKRMPQPPDLTGSTVTASPAAPGTLNKRLEALGIHRAPIATASDSAMVSEVAGEAEGEEPAIDDGSADTWDVASDVASDVAPDVASEPAAAASPSEEAPSTDQPAAPTRTGVLAQRLAQLDERLSGATATPAAVSDDADTETSTAIVVKGLGSFGAITSFKQALERVEGIRGVTLSLGPTGEFVYRATHLAGFDLLAAIRSVEGQTVEIEQEDGALRVTVSRTR